MISRSNREWGAAVIDGKARRFAYLTMCAGIGLVAASAVAAADPDSGPDTQRQSRDDAWWTGPILAAGANTLPRGHALIEPYVFSIISQGRYDEDGHRHGGPRRHSYGSLTYMLYGLVDDVTVGVIPRFGYNNVSVGQDSSGVQLGDFMVQGQYRFTQFREGSRVPTVSLVIAETLPTGEYDRLGTRPANALGSGAYTTTVSLYSQTYLWMPNGRIMRTRFNVSYSLPDTVSVEDVSIYGTAQGFRGQAKPGRVLLVNSAWEYSLTRSWVLALDVVYEHDERTTLSGFDFAPPGSNAQPLPVNRDFGSGEVFTLAPAVEYNWNSRMGVIVGTIFTVAGRNASASVIPVAAINMVF
jgi:hypothetical protein